MESTDHLAEHITIDQIIQKIWTNCSGLGKEGNKSTKNILTDEEIMYVLALIRQEEDQTPTIRELVLEDPNIIEIDGPVTVVGDIFAKIGDLLRIFEYGGLPPSTTYLFLGNYVDHGYRGIEVICLLYAYKIKYPKAIYLLRGNHEFKSVNRICGFFYECKKRYCVRVWKAFAKSFQYLSAAAIINDSIFCTHGGIIPELLQKDGLETLSSIPRVVDGTDNPLLLNMCFSSPSPKISSFSPNEISYGTHFGMKALTTFLNVHSFSAIVRSHSLQEDGFKAHFGGLCTTVFSAANFREAHSNFGAILQISEFNEIEHKQFSSCVKYSRKNKVKFGF
ncbi:unnamed protein product [Moneuplotes crassus]|uniref:Serine/threonine-protein phosphatase n=1 Tax=Euplotes crassus TaxID=5936 RepID=A0AAD1XJM1_EUPCR|nr:unnamed protein product [Moneuplotes crassus]